jgi:hypothetical protein
MGNFASLLFKRSMKCAEERQSLFASSVHGWRVNSAMDGILEPQMQYGQLTLADYPQNNAGYAVVIGCPGFISRANGIPVYRI